MDNLLSGLIGALVGAVVSSIVAVVLHRWAVRAAAGEYSRNRLHDARLAVEAVVSKIEGSELYHIQPHYELWAKGFASLNQSRILISAAKAHLRAVGQREVLHIIELLEKEHRPLIQLRDSFDRFMAELEATDHERILEASRWPDLHHAENALKRLQDAANRDLRELKDRARSMGG